MYAVRCGAACAHIAVRSWRDGRLGLRGDRSLDAHGYLLAGVPFLRERQSERQREADVKTPSPEAD